MSDYTTEELTTEEWRDVPGYEGRYQVSSLGQVRSLPHTIPHGRYKGRTRVSPGKMLKQSVASTGYYVVGVPDGRNTRKIEVHVWVALAFHGPRLPKHHVHHRDENKLNNHPGNLTYLHHGRHQELHSRKGQKLTAEKVQEIRRLLAMKSMFQKDIAEMFGVTPTQITCIKLGKTWSHI